MHGNRQAAVPSGDRGRRFVPPAAAGSLPVRSWDCLTSVVDLTYTGGPPWGAGALLLWGCPPQLRAPDRRPAASAHRRLCHIPPALCRRPAPAAYLVPLSLAFDEMRAAHWTWFNTANCIGSAPAPALLPIGCRCSPQLLPTLDRRSTAAPPRRLRCPTPCAPAAAPWRRRPLLPPLQPACTYWTCLRASTPALSSGTTCAKRSCWRCGAAACLLPVHCLRAGPLLQRGQSARAGGAAAPPPTSASAACGLRLPRHRSAAGACASPLGCAPARLPPLGSAPARLCPSRPPLSNAAPPGG